MDLKKRLELGQNKLQTCEVIDYVNDNPIRFKQLVDVYLKGPYRVTQHAARALSICIENHPYLVEPHLKLLVDFLDKPGVHDAVKRNTMRLLQFVNIPQSLQGKVTKRCVEYLEDPTVAVAIRVFSMTVLSNIAQQHPALKKELRIILEDQFPFGTAAFKSRARKILKKG